MTEATTYNHAGTSGSPTKGSSTSATAPAPIAISDVVRTVSSPTLMAAFQPAWQAAPNRTAAKTKDDKCQSRCATRPYDALGGAPKFSAKKASVRLQASSAAALL